MQVKGNKEHENGVTLPWYVQNSVGFIQKESFPLRKITSKFNC